MRFIRTSINLVNSVKARESAEDAPTSRIIEITTILLVFVGLSAIMQAAQNCAMILMAAGVALFSHSSHALDLFRRRDMLKARAEKRVFLSMWRNKSCCGGSLGPTFLISMIETRKQITSCGLRIARTTWRFQPYYKRGARQFLFFLRPAISIIYVGVLVVMVFVVFKAMAVKWLRLHIVSLY